MKPVMMWLSAMALRTVVWSVSTKSLTAQMGRMAAVSYTHLRAHET